MTVSPSASTSCGEVEPVDPEDTSVDEDNPVFENEGEPTTPADDIASKRRAKKAAAASSLRDVQQQQLGRSWDKQR
jgi:hypothetical protein